MGVGTGLMPRLGVRPLMSLSFFGAAAGLLISGGIHPGTSYGGGILPGMIVLGVFCGLGFPASASAALHKVTGQDSSLASGVQNAMQQAGGALGLACLATLALRHAASQIRHGVPPAIAATHGYVLSFRIGAALLAVGGMLALVLFEHVTAQLRNPAAEFVTDPPAARPATASVSPSAASAGLPTIHAASPATENTS